MTYEGSLVVERNLDCPLIDSQCRTCGATNRPMILDAKQQRIFCFSDDHDNCPFYLSFLLRRSRPKSRHSRQDEYAQK